MREYRVDYKARCKWKVVGWFTLRNAEWFIAHLAARPCRIVEES